MAISAIQSTPPVTVPKAAVSQAKAPDGDTLKVEAAQQASKKLSGTPNATPSAITNVSASTVPSSTGSVNKLV